ncbi:hypothetical protein M231_03992 [Tremella mesenterica]|uniref:D-3-phosphoglycerate dehydrogenase n=1 Tax=Tremella mesenterica TaxID=5217 RepID=A0A4Q1BM17_TREME|nr:hypothetical protein M231_03992 [Tremella mesenterica]
MPVAVKAKPRVYTLEPLHSQALELAREKFDMVLPDDEGFHEWREKAEGLLARNAMVTPEDVEVLKAHKIRYIAKQGVGVDNFDLPSLKAAEIPLMNTPGINATAVAEMALTLLMDVARSATTVDRRIRRGDKVNKLMGWEGQLIRGRTLGIIGGGNIGLAFAEMFNAAFRGSILVYDPVIAADQKAKWTAVIPSEQVKFVTLDDLLGKSDIVSVHCPLNNHTRDIISTRELGLMKSTAIILNTARGGVINEPALEKVLREGKIYGAGLDAFVDEPPSLEKYGGFCELDNVVLTPHFGATPAAVQQETCLSMVEHLVEAFEGKPLRDRVV